MGSWDKIVTSTPLDGTAASVTSQANVSHSVEMDVFERREVLRREYAALAERLKNLSQLTKPEYKKLSARYAELSKQLREIKLEIKAIRPTDDKSFIYAAHRLLPRETINRIEELAAKIQDGEDRDDTTKTKDC